MAVSVSLRLAALSSSDIHTYATLLIRRYKQAICYVQAERIEKTLHFHNRTKEFDAACSHVGFCSDLRWSACNPDQYTLANRKLWILLNQIKCLFLQQKLPRTVQSTIPNSRLATYGNFQYDEERERLYTEDNILSSEEHLETCSSAEPWQLPEVEQHFRYFTALRTAETIRWPQNAAPNRRNDVVALLKKLNSPSQVLQLADEEWQTLHQFVALQLRSQDKDHALEAYQHYHVKNSEEQQLQRRIDSVKFLWDRYVPAGLQHSFPFSSAVPEFHPRIFTRPLTYFPSSSEKNYADELFPYRCEECTNSPLQQPVTYRSPKKQLSSFFKNKDSQTRSIPVYQRPVEFYTQHQDGSNITWGRRRQGVDYSNLIFLTHGGKGHHKHHGTRHHSRDRQPHPDLAFHPQPVQFHLHDWLQTTYPEQYCEQTHTTADAISRGSFPASVEQRYEELERIAIEEYRSPDDQRDTPEDNSEAFEDLERLAIEQYEAPTAAKSRQLTVVMAMTDVPESLPFLSKKSMLPEAVKEQEHSPRTRTRGNSGSTRKRRRRTRARRLELETNEPEDGKTQLEENCDGRMVPLGYFVKSFETWGDMHNLGEQGRINVQDLVMISLVTGLPTLQPDCQVSFMKQVLFQQHMPTTSLYSRLNALQIMPTAEEPENDEGARGFPEVDSDQQSSADSESTSDLPSHNGS